jgi:orotate phosphoribosyltransferase
MMSHELREQLVGLLAERSAKKGRFTLSSGRESTLYIDARLTTMSPEGLVLIGALGFDALNRSDWNIGSVGGLTLGADPVAYAIAYTSELQAQRIRAFTVRKETKSHGTGQLIEGPFHSGDRVAIIEDVITTGGSALRAITAVRNAGGNVLGVLAVVDREEGGRDLLEKEGLSVIALTTATDILQRMR